jgi:hypothetical protein
MARVIPCTHIKPNGKRCRGSIVRVEASQADLAWRRGADAWSFDVGQPKSFRLYCSAGSHEALKVSYSDLPAALRSIATMNDVEVDLDDHVDEAAV